MPRGNERTVDPATLRPTRNSRNEKFLFAPGARFQRGRPDSGSGPPPPPRRFSGADCQHRPWRSALLTDRGNAEWLEDKEVPRRRRRGRGGTEPRRVGPTTVTAARVAHDSQLAETR